MYLIMNLFIHKVSWFMRKLKIAMILYVRSYQSNLSNYAKINNFFLMKKQLNLIFLFCFLLQHFIVHYKKSLLICKSMCLIVNEEVSWLLKPKRQYLVPRNFNKGTENRQWKCNRDLSWRDQHESEIDQVMES